MTVLLTPVETIFDDLTIMGLEKHWHRTPVCDDCEDPATHRYRLLCCKKVMLACTRHWDGMLADLNRFFDGRGVECLLCHTKYKKPQTISDVIREVPL